jgi:hypothetical protein
MHRVMFLENQSIDIESENPPIRVSIRGENFFAEELGNNSRSRHFFESIDSIVDSTADLDIELKLAYFEGSLVLYWKETFHNRIYRQGLFSIIGHEVRRLCEGHGGSESEP